MNPMKRFGLAAALLVGLLLLPRTPAHAKAPARADWGTIPLTNVGDEPRALGEATLTSVECIRTLVHWEGEGSVEQTVYTYKSYTGVLTVTCRNLTPGATYQTPAGTFKADRTGTGRVKGKVSFGIETVYNTYWGTAIFLNWFVLKVDRIEPNGSTATVLEGDFLPPG